MPISVAPPAKENTDRRVVVHEPAPKEVLVTEEIPAADPTAAEDIGTDANVQNDDDVLPQLENMVSSPVPEQSEQISIGSPLTPMDRDEVIPHIPPAQDATTTEPIL